MRNLSESLPLKDRAINLLENLQGGAAKAVRSKNPSLVIPTRNLSESRRQKDRGISLSENLQTETRRLVLSKNPPLVIPMRSLSENHLKDLMTNLSKNHSPVIRMTNLLENLMKVPDPKIADHLKSQIRITAAPSSANRLTSGPKKMR